MSLTLFLCTAILPKYENLRDLDELAADCFQLAKASTFALISMLVIIVTVITQGTQVPPDLRGNIKGSLFVRDGVFQAIGVISFGKKLLISSISMSTHRFQHLFAVCSALDPLGCDSLTQLSRS